MEIQVLYEDEACLILNKPSGLPVQGGVGISMSLDSILEQKYAIRPLLVHRLDRDTSGVILVAKDKIAAARYSLLFGEARVCRKKYLAVCAGAPKFNTGNIHMDINVQGANKSCETGFSVLETVLFPVSVFEVFPQLKSYEQIFSLMELVPETGRMHQLRQHMALSKTPILGDDKYGDFSLNKALRKTMKLKHLLLHASSLSIPKGHGVLPIDVIAPVPAHFTNFLEQTENSRERDWGSGTGD